MLCGSWQILPWPRNKPHPLSGIQEEQTSHVNSPRQADVVCQHSNTDANTGMQGLVTLTELTPTTTLLYVYICIILCSAKACTFILKPASHLAIQYRHTYTLMKTFHIGSSTQKDISWRNGHTHTWMYTRSHTLCQAVVSGCRNSQGHRTPPYPGPLTAHLGNNC